MSNKGNALRTHELTSYELKELSGRSMIHFQLSTEYIELSQLLKVTGLCASGGASKQAVAEGLVKVDGMIETRKGRKIRGGCEVEYGGERIEVMGSAAASA